MLSGEGVGQIVLIHGGFLRAIQRHTRTRQCRYRL